MELLKYPFIAIMENGEAVIAITDSKISDEAFFGVKGSMLSDSLPKKLINRMLPFSQKEESFGLFGQSLQDFAMVKMMKEQIH